MKTAVLAEAAMQINIRLFLLGSLVGHACACMNTRLFVRCLIYGSHLFLYAQNIWSKFEACLPVVFSYVPVSYTHLTLPTKA